MNFGVAISFTRCHPFGKSFLFWFIVMCPMHGNMIPELNEVYGSYGFYLENSLLKEN